MVWVQTKAALVREAYIEAEALVKRCLHRSHCFWNEQQVCSHGIHSLKHFHVAAGARARSFHGVFKSWVLHQWFCRRPALGCDLALLRHLLDEFMKETAPNDMWQHQIIVRQW